MPESTQVNVTIEAQFAQGAGYLKAGQWREGEEVYRQILLRQPAFPEAHYNYGLALKNQGNGEGALASFRTAIALRPDFAEPWNSLGDTLREMKRPEEGVEALRRAVALRADFAEAWCNLGVALRHCKKFGEAANAHRRVVSLRPDYFQAWNELGNILSELKQLPQAAEAYRQALKLKSDLPELWSNLGNVLSFDHQAVEAIDAYQRALELRPDYVDALNNLAGVLQSVGRLDETLACLDKIAAVKPDHVQAHDARVCTMHYHARYDAAAIYQELRRWNERFAKPLEGQILPHGNDPAPGRRLRIGYVSSDFRKHCESLFTMPLLSHHDHQAFEIFCYSSVAAPDSTTARLQRHADVWRDVSELKDDALAQRIRDDKIDILVDLTLHMAGNRLLAFARKPAPVQVSWLGYPGSTGMDVMDYRMTDGQLDPAGDQIRNPKPEIRINDPNPNDPNPKVPDSRSALEHPESLTHSDIGKLTSASSVEPGFDSDFGFRISDFATKEPYYSERSIRLPDCFWCYDPCAAADIELDQMPKPGPLPALKDGRITFGCLNNFAKVTDLTLDLWARVMAAVPRSQILLAAAPGEHRERALAKLGGPERVQFLARQYRRQYFEAYRGIDLCLDPLPCNGGTTSCDALWMGVPLVTRVGWTVVGRAGWTLLHNLGLPELIARTDEEFIRIVAELAGDLDRLAQLRATLRQRMEASPLMDGARFARNMEAAYRQMWRTWCQAQDARGKPRG